MDADERVVQKVGNEYRYAYDFLGRYKMKKVDNTQEWLDFMKGLKRGMAYGFGPTVYAQFEAVAGLVNEGNKRNDPKLSLRDLVLGVNAVELMKETFYDYGVVQKGELNTDDYEQFVQLYTRMREAYNKEYGYPLFPKDLHGRNCMYKLVDGKRVWLFTDIDESPDYMQPNTDDPRTMAIKMFNGIQRPDAMRNPPPRRVAPPPKPVTPPKPAAVKKKTSPRKQVAPPAMTLAEQHAMMMEAQAITKRAERARQERIAALAAELYPKPASPRKASPKKKSPTAPTLTLAQQHAMMMEAQRVERERLEANLAALRAAEAAARAAAAAPIYVFKPASRKPSPKKKPSPPKAKKRSSPKKKNLVPTSSYLARLEARNAAILKRAGMAAPDVSPKRRKSSPKAAPMSGVVDKVRSPPRVYKPYSPMMMDDLSSVLH